MFYRVVSSNTIMVKPSVTVVKETINELNLKNYKIDFEIFDNEVESIIKRNMFYK